MNLTRSIKKKKKKKPKNPKKNLPETVEPLSSIETSPISISFSSFTSSDYFSVLVLASHLRSQSPPVGGFAFSFTSFSSWFGKKVSDFVTLLSDLLQLLTWVFLIWCN
jgi:hypothetical protein